MLRAESRPQTTYFAGPWDNWATPEAARLDASLLPHPRPLLLFHSTAREACVWARLCMHGRALVTNESYGAVLGGTAGICMPSRFCPCRQSARKAQPLCQVEWCVEAAGASRPVLVSSLQLGLPCA